MRNVSDKSCGENQNTHFVFNKFFPKNIVNRTLLLPTDAHNVKKHRAVKTF